MKKLIGILTLTLSIQAYAWDKTCDATAVDKTCTEHWANFGQPPQCAIGLPSTGKHCNKATDLGMCRYNANNGNFKQQLDTYYYAGYATCMDLTDEECSAQLEESCIMSLERKWFAPGATH